MPDYLEREHYTNLLESELINRDEGIAISEHRRLILSHAHTMPGHEPNDGAMDTTLACNISVTPTWKEPCLEQAVIHAGNINAFTAKQ